MIPRALRWFAWIPPVVALGCSEGGPVGADPSRDIAGQNPATNAENSGTVGAQLTLPSGQDIEAVQWTITGPSGAATIVQSGTLKVANTPTVRFLVSNIPAAQGYRILISGSASDGSVICSGSAAFDITPRVTTPVPIALACSVATNGAQVTLVSGVSFNCAALNSVSASPLETTVGHSVSLSAMATGPVQSAVTYSWSASSGTFDTGSSPTTNFTCTAAGPAIVTLTAGDGPVPLGASCNADLSTRTVTITCDAVVVPPVPVPAMPPWVVAMLGASMAALGAFAGRPRSRRGSAVA